MIGEFRFANRSSRDFGLYVTGVNPYSAPERDVEIIQIPGRNGDLILDNGRYSNINVIYTVFVRNRLNEKMRAIRPWLMSTPNYQRLEDTYDPDYYRLASYRGPFDVEHTLHQFGQCDLTFNCKPYRYRKDGEVIIERSGGSDTAPVYNPEEISSSPYIRISGSGSGDLIVNSNKWTITDVQGYIEIDSELMNAYKGTLLQNHKVKGDGFPTLIPGKNQIYTTIKSWKLEIKPRWCTL